jgi:DNA-directed RNA polymerase specialized sigma24 family protein
MSVNVNSADEFLETRTPSEFHEFLVTTLKHREINYRRRWKTDVEIYLKSRM